MPSFRMLAPATSLRAKAIIWLIRQSLRLDILQSSRRAAWRVQRPVDATEAGRRRKERHTSARQCGAVGGRTKGKRGTEGAGRGKKQERGLPVAYFRDTTASPNFYKRNTTFAVTAVANCDPNRSAITTPHTPSTRFKIVRSTVCAPEDTVPARAADTEARSQHVSLFRGARRTGVHYLRKNMRAPDRALLYLRGT